MVVYYLNHISFGHPECRGPDRFSQSTPTGMLPRNSIHPPHTYRSPLLPFNMMLRGVAEYRSARWPPSREDKNVHPALFRCLRLGVDCVPCSLSLDELYHGRGYYVSSIQRFPSPLLIFICRTHWAWVKPRSPRPELHTKDKPGSSSSSSA